MADEEEVGAEFALGRRIPLNIHQSNSRDLHRLLLRRASTSFQRNEKLVDAEIGWQVFSGRLLKLQEAAAQGCAVTAGKCDFDLEEFRKDAVVGKYKDRPVDGRLLHHALWHDFNTDDAEAVATKIVLQAGARVDSLFVSRASRRLELQAIHMAAGLGYGPGINVLLEFQADLGAMTLRDGAKHYSALHDAVYLQQASTVQLLLHRAADLSVLNADSMSVLHVAAWAGSDHLLQLLTQAPNFPPDILLHRAPLSIFGGREQNLTPLGLAAFSSNCPENYLLQLAPFYHGKGSFFSEVRELVHINPKKALGFVQGVEDAPAELRSKLATWIVQEALRSNGKYCNSMSTRYSKQSLVNCLADIIYQAPLVALKILHIVTVKPYIADTVALKHPVPQTSSMRSFDPITRMLGHCETVLTAYEADYSSAEHCFVNISEYHDECAKTGGLLGLPEWKMNVEGESIPDWHREFMDMNRQHADWLQSPAVSCMVICVPSILDVRVVHAINATHILDMFAHPSVLGIGQELWKLALRVFYLDCLMEIVVTAILADRAVRLQEGDHRVHELRPGMLYDQFCLSLLLGEVLRNFFRLVHLMAMHKGYYKFKRGLLATKTGPIPKIFGEVMRMLMMFGYLMLATQRLGNIDWDDDHHRRLGMWDHLFLCVNCFLHLIKNLNMLCYISGVGPKMNALMESLAPMGSMLFVGAGLWTAFLVPLLSLRGEAPAWKVAQSLFSSMARADTNVLPFLEGLDSGSVLGGITCKFFMSLVAVMFSICYMNLLIGMYGNVYSAREKKSHLLFARARFHMAERYLLEPVWKLTGDSWLTRQSNAECGAIGWTLLPFLLSALCFALWLLAVCLALPMVLAGVLFAACLLLLQAAMMQNSKFNHDVDINGLHVFDEDGGDDDEDREDSDTEPGVKQEAKVDIATKCLDSDPSRTLLPAADSSSCNNLQSNSSSSESARRCLWVIQRRSNHQATDEPEDLSRDPNSDIIARLDALAGQVAELQKHIMMDEQTTPKASVKRSQHR